MHAVYCEGTCVASYRDLTRAKEEAASLRAFFPWCNVFILPA
jgi:hypothetical protein